MGRWCDVTFLAASLFAASCSDDGTAKNRLLLWVVPDALAPSQTALVVADISNVTGSAKNSPGCVVITTSAGSLSVPIVPAAADMGAPACIAPRCITALASSTHDSLRRAYATYQAPSSATTDVLTALFYDGMTCPPPLTTSPTVQTAVTVAVGPVTSPTDASATVADLARGDNDGGAP